MSTETIIVEQLRLAVDDLLYWIDCPDEERVSRPEWETKMIERIGQAFDAAIAIAEVSGNAAPSVDVLSRNRAEAVGLIQVMNANPKLRLQDWGDHSPASLGKLRKFVASLEPSEECETREPEVYCESTATIETVIASPAGRMTANDRLHLLYKNTPESVEWRSAVIAGVLSVSESAIRKCPAWTARQNARRGAKADRRESDVIRE